MEDYLVFRLYGSIAAWGEIAVGETRASFTHPSRSAILGLIAGTLGIRRDEGSVHDDLEAAYALAIRVDNPGELLVDFHTVQAPVLRKGVIATSRGDAFRKGTIGTLITRRDYYCDAHYTICLWCRGSSSPRTLTDIAESLQNPVFTTWLGRKSCPLCAPMEPQILQAASFKGALDDYSVKFDLLTLLLEQTHADDLVSIYWDATEESDIKPTHTITRRDRIISRKRWQFGQRQEHYTTERRSDP